MQPLDEEVDVDGDVGLLRCERGRGEARRKDLAELGVLCLSRAEDAVLDNRGAFDGVPLVLFGAAFEGPYDFFP